MRRSVTLSALIDHVTPDKRMGWFGDPPAKQKWRYSHLLTNGVPKPHQPTDPFWMDSKMSGDMKYNSRGPNVNHTKHNRHSWDRAEGEVDGAGDPTGAMPPVGPLGVPLVPREEAALFMPDIFIDGLADEVMGPLRSMARHVVPHQFRQHHDESMALEESKVARSHRQHIWKANLALYIARHPMADDMQRELMKGTDFERERFQDPDDKDYEREMVEALAEGDLDKAASAYKLMSDPPRNYAIYTRFLEVFAERGLLGDAMALYSEMRAHRVPLHHTVFRNILRTAVAADHPMRVMWAFGEARKELPSCPKDALREMGMEAMRYFVARKDAVLTKRTYDTLVVCDVLDIDVVVEHGEELQAKAAALGLLPPCEGDEEYSHRFVYSFSDGGDGPEAKSEASGGDYDDATSSRRRFAEAVQARADLPETTLNVNALLRSGWSVDEVREAIALIVSIDDPEDPELPYMKKSNLETPVKTNVMQVFDYSLHGKDKRYPCTSIDMNNNPIPITRRYRFRWHPKGRFVEHGRTTTPDMWFTDEVRV